MTKIKVAFARGKNNEFGYKGGMPWGMPLAGDMVRFKEFTENSVLVMGSGTYKSLPRNLRDLIHVVVSRGDPQAKNGDRPHQIIKDFSERSLRLIADVYDMDVVVIGGAGFIEVAAMFADEILRTTIDDSFEFDSQVMADVGGFPETIWSYHCDRLEVDYMVEHYIINKG
jgi:dihydrofolate reductase